MTALPSSTPNLSREAAVRWFHDQGVEHISVEYLEKLAARGKGPKQFRLGKYVYYSRNALFDWLTSETLRGSEPRRRRGAAAA